MCRPTMNVKINPLPKKAISHSFSLAILAAILVTIYSNSLHVQWQFDDEPNILRNQALHLDSLSVETMYHSLLPIREEGTNCSAPCPT